MNQLKIFLISAGIFLSGQVLASPLDDARAAGLVKELESGFVKAASSADAATRAMVADVNKRRQAAYKRIAAKHKLTPAQVGKESYKKRQQ